MPGSFWPKAKIHQGLEATHVSSIQSQGVLTGSGESTSARLGLPNLAFEAIVPLMFFTDCLF